MTWLRLSDARSVLISGSWDPTVRLWDAAGSCTRWRRAKGTLTAVRAVAAVHDEEAGQLLVLSGGDDKTVRLWRGLEGTDAGVVMRHKTAGCISVAFLPKAWRRGCAPARPERVGRQCGEDLGGGRRARSSSSGRGGSRSERRGDDSARRRTARWSPAVVSSVRLWRSLPPVVGGGGGWPVARTGRGQLRLLRCRSSRRRTAGRRRAQDGRARRAPQGVHDDQGRAAVSVSVCVGVCV